MANRNGFLPVDPKYYDTPVLELYRAKITQIEMIRDRGYYVSEQELRILTPQSSDPIADFINHYEAMKVVPVINSLSNIYEHKATGKTLYVAFRQSEDNKPHLSTNLVNELIKEFDTTQADSLMLISAYTPSPQARNLLEGLPDYEFFHIKRLQSNITKHKLQPFEIKALSKEEISQEIKLPLNKLPRMNIEDALAKYYRWPAGAIIRKKERSIPGGYLIENISYLIVVDEPRKNTEDSKY